MGCVSVNPYLGGRGGDIMLFARAPSDNVKAIAWPTMTVRAVVSVGDVPGRPCYHPFLPLAYVPNAGDDTVSVIDLVTLTVVATFSGAHLDQPSAVVMSIDGTKLYVANADDLNVVSLNSTSGALITTGATLASAPLYLALERNGAKLYAATANTIAVLDATSLTENITALTASDVYRIRCSPIADKLYGCRNGSNDAFIVDTSTDGLSTMTLDGIGCDLDFDLGGFAYFAINNSHEAIQRVTVSSNTPGTRLDLTSNPAGLCLNRARSRAYLPCTDGKIKIVDAATMTLLSTFDATSIGGSCIGHPFP